MHRSVHSHIKMLYFLIVFLWFFVFQSQKLDTFHSQVRELTKGNVITPPGKTRWTKPSDGSPLDSTRNIYHRNVHTLHTLCWALTRTTLALKKELMSWWPCTLSKFLGTNVHSYTYKKTTTTTTKMSTCSFNSFLWTVNEHVL